MGNEFPDHFGHEEEMIVIDPYCIAALVLTYDDFSKGPVDSNIVLPTIRFPNLGLWIIRDLVMECRPNDLLAISIVMTLEIGVGNEDWNRLLVSVEVIHNIHLLRLCQCICRLGPPPPKVNFLHKMGIVSVVPCRGCQPT
jgi:hypothetical protein